MHRFCLLSFDALFGKRSQHISSFEGFDSKKDVINYLKLHPEIIPKDEYGADPLCTPEVLDALEYDSPQLTHDYFILVEATNEVKHFAKNMLALLGTDHYWTANGIALFEHSQVPVITKPIDPANSFTVTLSDGTTKTFTSISMDEIPDEAWGSDSD